MQRSYPRGRALLAALAVLAMAAVPAVAAADGPADDSRDAQQHRAQLLGRLFDITAYQQASSLLAAPSTPRPATPASTPDRPATSQLEDDRTPPDGQRTDDGPSTPVSSSPPDGEHPDGHDHAPAAHVDTGPGGEHTTAAAPTGRPQFEFHRPHGDPSPRGQDTDPPPTIVPGYDPMAALPDPVPVAPPADATGGSSGGGGSGDAPVLRASADGWYCPVAGPHTFINDWGFPRSGGRTHEGNDVFADEGTPLVAMTDGRVTRVQPADVGLGGRTVTYVSDDDGTRFYYAHLHTIEPGLKVGDTLEAGQVLGTVGRTGNARTTPPHLHLGFYRGARAFNPYPTIRAACR